MEMLSFGIGIILGMSWWLLTIFLFFVGVMLYSSIEEIFPLAIISSIILCIVLYFGIDWSLVSINLSSLFSFIIIYIIIGLVWSLIKHIMNVYHSIKKIKSVPVYSRDTIDEIKKYIRREVGYNSNISFWLFFWPLSMLNFILGDFIRNLIDFIKGLYAKVTDFLIDRLMLNFKGV